jgi:peroxiredoxin
LFYLATMLYAQRTFAVGIGDPFPLFSRPNTLSAEECAMLGISPDKEFSLNDIRHDVTILEFLNVYCHTCRQQVQIFNELNKTLKNDPELNGKACIIGIAVGNTGQEIQDFKKNFGADYPILPDTKKEIFTMTGNIQGTPHTYILRKEEQRFIIDYHAGGVASPDRYLETVRFALRGTFVGTGLGNKVLPYAFLSNGVRKDSSSISGKPVVLYFPVKKSFPVTIDTRNRGNQIRILHDIRRKFPEVTVIAFQSATVTLPTAIADPSFLIADETADEPLAAFRSPDSPTVYFVNSYGRISFKGEAITLYNAESILQGKEYKPELKMTDREIIERIEQRIVAAGMQPDGTEKEMLDTGKALYVTALKPRRDGVCLFSLLEKEVP